MSALQIPSRPTTLRPAGPTTSGDGRPPLRLVETARSTLAPSGPLQAWRRRFAALLVLVAAVVLAVLAVEAVRGPVAPVQDVVPASSATAVVEPGQTLWDVANEHAPADVGTDAYVRALAEINGIANGAVDAWQVLRLPAG